MEIEGYTVSVSLDIGREMSLTSLLNSTPLNVTVTGIHFFNNLLNA